MSLSARVVRSLSARLALVPLLACAACTAEPTAPPPLDAREIRLVEEVLELMEIRIERARDPQAAEIERQELAPGLYDPDEVNALLDQLAADPRRAQLFAEAVKESLEQRRLRLFPPETVEPDSGAGF